MTIPKTWQQDRRFVGWLVRSEYAHLVDGKPLPFLSAGVVIYMWEAWVAGGSGTS